MNGLDLGIEYILRFKMRYVENAPSDVPALSLSIGLANLQSVRLRSCNIHAGQWQSYSGGVHYQHHTTFKLAQGCRGNIGDSQPEPEQTLAFPS